MAWRESFDVPPMVHQNPIPTATRVGNLLFTSAIAGRDLETGQVPESTEQQAANAFAILGRILERAGATPGDVGHVTVFLRDNADRAHVNTAWLAMFPDSHSRPARHTILDPNLAVPLQIEAIAVVQG